MTALSDDTHARARKNHSTILQRLSSVGQTRVAEALDVSESTVSRIKELDLGKFLAVLGLKAVPVAMQCYEPKQIGAILELARARMAQLDKPSLLEWDEPE